MTDETPYYIKYASPTGDVTHPHLDILVERKQKLNGFDVRPQGYITETQGTLIELS